MPSPPWASPTAANSIGGSFFDPIPCGADVYLMKSILHDWDDDHCSTIMRRVADAMSESGGSGGNGNRLLVIERIRPERFAATERDRSIARSDLNMLVSLGGRERTEHEYRDLLATAGLAVRRIAELSNAFSVIEASLA